MAYFCAVLRFSDPPYAPLLNGLSTPEGRESDLYISFLREMGKKKKDKKKSRDRAGDIERYVSTSLTDLVLAGKGPGIEFLGRSNITIPPGQ